MARYIDADKKLEEITERFCNDCERRKGMKNGKKRFIYEIGGVPCRACDVDDLKIELENTPTADVVEVVRCKDCWKRDFCLLNTGWCNLPKLPDDWFCKDGERRDDAEIH